jgi:uncharacterized protein with beta-barrel porin domain
VRLGYARRLTDDASAALSINGLAGSAFTVGDSQHGRDAAILSVGLSAPLSQTVTISGEFDGTLSSGASAAGGAIKISVAF